MATILIDGKEYRVADDRNCLEAALDHELDLPYFCWHPAMGSVGACRLCAVKQYRDEGDETGRLVMACMTPADDGTRISIRDEEAARFRRAVIEWLMINHPHDCPVCDEGGECHLQDMTVMTGHSHRRYRGTKRTFRNQDLGPVIHHEMNRCITCYRCTRYYQDVAGGDDLRAFASRDRVYFGRVEAGTLESPFSGNLVEVCPTGVFTDKTYRRHYTRKWDLVTAPSVCSHCGLGCNTLPAARYDSLRRVTSRYNHEINGYWLCDRGRFGYEFANAEDRPIDCRARPADGGGDLRTIEVDRVATGLRDAVATARAAGELAVVGSPRASLESNWAAQQLVGPERFCPGTSNAERGLLARWVNALRGGEVRPASLRRVGEADAVVVLGCDPTHEAPLVDLAVLRAMREQEASLAVVHVGPTRLASRAEVAARLTPDETALLAETIGLVLTTGDEERLRAALPEPLHEPARRIVALLSGARRPVIVTGLWARSAPLLEAAIRLCGNADGGAHGLDRDEGGADRPDDREGGRTAELCVAVSEPDSVGVSVLDDGAGPGVDELVEAIEAGAVTTLVVIENDLFERVADPGRLGDALEKLDRLVVVEQIVTPTAERADWLLPAATVPETEGTFVNNEARAQRFFRAATPPGAARPSWAWLRDLAGAGWQDHGELLDALVVDRPDLEVVREVAPPPGFRAVSQKIPRLSHRSSGRTAMPGNDDVRRHPRPQDDPDSPFADSMEGFQGRPPTPLINRLWAPGWNSNEAINQFQIEVGGPLHGGDPGRLLFATGSAAASGAPDTAVPPAEPLTPGPESLLLWGSPEIFASEATSRRAPGVAARGPAPRIAMRPETAEAHGLAAGPDQELRFEVGDRVHHARLEVTLDDGVPEGGAVITTGVPQTRWWQRPVAARVETAAKTAQGDGR